MGKRIQPLSLLLMAADIVIVPIILALAAWMRSTVELGTAGALPEAATQVPWPFYGLAVVVWAISLASSGAYNPQLALRWFNEAWRVVWGSGVATVVLAGALYMTYRQISRLQFIYFFVIATGLMLGVRGGLRIYYRIIGRTRPGSRNRILILGAGELGERVARVLLDHSRWGYHPVGFLDDDPALADTKVHGLPVLGKLDSLRGKVEERSIDELWVALPAGSVDRLGEVIAQVETVPVRVKVVPDYFSYALIRTKPEVLGDLPVIGLRDPLIEGVPRLIKRAFDVLVAALLLIPSLPLMGILALLIRLGSQGPALIRQERVGENGRPFQMLKLRTMTQASDERAQDVARAETDGTVIHKTPDDPRVTAIGRFLRRFSLDELPQLFNVVKGDMSLVGPRPELPWLVDRYESWQRKRFAVPQGITGWWQINGRSERPMHLHTEDDLYYVYNYSLWLDIYILLRTPLAVLRGQGAF